jgi:hypothetical protein
MQTRKERIIYLRSLLKCDAKQLKNKFELVNRLAVADDRQWDEEHERILQLLEKKFTE